MSSLQHIEKNRIVFIYDKIYFYLFTNSIYVLRLNGYRSKVEYNELKMCNLQSEHRNNFEKMIYSLLNYQLQKIIDN